MLEKMDFEVIYITLGRIRRWREHLDEVVEAIMNMTTVMNVDIVECFFTLTELKKVVCLPIRRINMSCNLFITDNNYYEFILEMSAMEMLRELDTPYYCVCGYQFNTLLKIVKLIDLLLPAVERGHLWMYKILVWKKTRFV